MDYLIKRKSTKGRKFVIHQDRMRLFKSHVINDSSGSDKDVINKPQLKRKYTKDMTKARWINNKKASLLRSKLKEANIDINTTANKRKRGRPPKQLNSNPTIDNKPIVETTRNKKRGRPSKKMTDDTKINNDKNDNKLIYSLRNRQSAILSIDIYEKRNYTGLLKIKRKFFPIEFYEKL